MVHLYDTKMPWETDAFRRTLPTVAPFIVKRKEKKRKELNYKIKHKIVPGGKRCTNLVKLYGWGVIDIDRPSTGKTTNARPMAKATINKHRTATTVMRTTF